MFATQVLPETPGNDWEGENNISDIIGLIIVHGKEYDLKRGETKIGRDPTMCSVVIENPTVSKVHAIVESEGIDDTFIYDVGSTNQTKLGKKVLKPHCRYKLDDKSIITLGNITAKFVLPPDRSSNTVSQEARPVRFDELNDLEDIFDMPTQVSAAQPSSSSTKDFEPLPETVEIFKIPNSGSLAFKSAKSFDEDTQDRLDSQRTIQKTVFGSFENSGIFSVGTQYQLYEHSEGEKCDVQTVASDENKNKNSEPDEIKSLLDDGQDEVLCTFMSLHSPKEESRLLKEIKTEILTQDTPTEAEKIQESVEEKERRELDKILRDEDLTEDFPARSMPSITSTPLNRNIGQFKISDRNDSHTEHPDEEDFIQTQEFNVNRLKSSKRREAARDDRDSLSEDVETQPYIGGGSDEVEASQREHDDEDIILTQAFQVSEKRPENKQSPTVIPETEETVEFKEDFLETQIFPAENKAGAGGLEGESGVGRSVHLTERNGEEDLIETQIFEDARKSDSGWDRSDGEDFIATQRVNSPVNMTSGDSGEGGVTVRGSSRENSPDLLTAETLPKNSEDCISTQIFEPVVHQNLVTDVLVSEKDYRDLARSQSVESSGDETESDLEIILEKKETGGGFIKCEPVESNPRVLEVQENDESNSSYIFELGAGNQPERRNEEENKRPVAQQQSDSDETDCEEMEITNPMIPVKQQPKVVFEETQVLPQTLPDDYAEKADNNWGMGAESPKFIADSPLSLEMPNTQDIEATMNRMLRNTDSKDFETPSKTEVGITKKSVTSSRGNPSENPVDTPLKRPRDNSGVGIVPVKKYKTENSSDRLLRSSEKKFSKLVQTHDISQIQPSRTRNSLKNVTTEREVRLGNNIKDGHIAQIRPSRTRKSLKNVTTEIEVQLGNNVNNDRPTSRRKSNPKKGGGKNQNGDITSYLTRRVERRPSPNENRPVVGTDRVLRSSMKRATATVLTTSPERNGRSSKTKTEEHFSGSHVNIVFTGFDCEKLESIISDLGGKKTNDLSSAEVVVADKVRRTVKFLSAIGLSLPIVSPKWLLSSKREKKFLNPWNFILKDKESEKRWDFELRASLERAKKVKLFKGFSVFATKSTKPPVKDLLAIVEFCGGTPLFDSPNVWPKKTIIVSCLEDKKWWPLTKYRNVKIVHYEFILSGVLKQEIDFKTYKLR